MSHWTVDTPTTQTLDGIVALKVRIVGGHVNILPTDDPVTFEITDIVGEPVTVTQEAGILTIHYEDLTTQGFLDRLKPVQLSTYKNVGSRRATVNLRVPAQCPVEVSTASAPVVAAALSSRTSINTATGEVTLDDVSGETEINTASGDVSVRNVGGSLSFKSASGQLAVAGGCLSSLNANTASGQILADADLADSAKVRLKTVSGEIALRVPAETSASAELHSVAGTLESDFGLDRRTATARNALSGSIGAGPARADISTNNVSGKTTLLRRAPEAPAAIPEGA